MKTITLFLFCLVGLQAQAAGAIKYNSLKDAMKSKFYRLTCSDKNAIEAHIYAEVVNAKLTTLQIISIAPSESLKVISYSEKDLTNMKVVEAVTTAKIAGTRTGAYFDEDFELAVQDEGQNITATLTYDDHDGIYLRRVLKCGAVNYILAPYDQ